MLYNEDNLKKSMDKIQAVNYHQEIEHNGIKFWCYNAGHVLGAAMFMVELAGVRVLYTGDFSRQEDRHLMAAVLPSSNVDVLVIESTYGVQTHEPREERETRFTSALPPSPLLFLFLSQSLYIYSPDVVHSARSVAYRILRRHRLRYSPAWRPLPPPCLCSWPSSGPFTPLAIEPR